jgi:hypothetical protein
VYYARSPGALFTILDRVNRWFGPRGNQQKTVIRGRLRARVGGCGTAAKPLFNLGALS